MPRRSSAPLSSSCTWKDPLDRAQTQASIQSFFTQSKHVSTRKKQQTNAMKRRRLSTSSSDAMIPLINSTSGEEMIAYPSISRCDFRAPAEYGTDNDEDASVSSPSSPIPTNRSRNELSLECPPTTPLMPSEGQDVTNLMTPPSTASKLVVSSQSSSPDTPTRIVDGSPSSQTTKATRTRTKRKTMTSNKQRPSYISPVEESNSASSVVAKDASPSPNKPSHNTILWPASNKDKNNTKTKKFEQLYLDFGQSNLGKRNECQICGMLYLVGMPQEEKAHASTCDPYRYGVTWPKSSKGIKQIASTKLFSIIQVQPHRLTAATVKDTLDQVLAIVRQDLGSTVEEDNKSSSQPTVYLYLHKQRVVGVATMERITQAYPVIHNIDDDDGEYHQASMRRSKTSQKAILGVSQIWTHANHRRQGIAQQLLDAARSSMVFGVMTVSVSKLAFSSPTTAGYGLAVSYCRKRRQEEEEENVTSCEVLVYDSEAS